MAVDLAPYKPITSSGADMERIRAAFDLIQGALAANGISYVYSTDTASTDPGSGKVKFNSATLASITSIRISETDNDGNALAAFIQAWDDSTSSVRGILTIVKEGTPSNVLILGIGGALTDNGTWDSGTVTYITSSGSFANNDRVRLFFTRTGDKGDTGATGATGATGSAGGVTEYDYATRTTNLTVTATTEAGADTVKAGGAVTYDGSTRVKIEIFSPVAQITASQALVNTLWDGSTDLGRLREGNEVGGGVYGCMFVTPTAGSHTYTWKAWKTGGTATIVGGSGGTGAYFPAFLRITGA